MHDEDDSMGLATALRALRAEVAAARQDAEAAGLTFSITSVTVEMRAGARVPFSAEPATASAWKSESRQTVTIALGAPTDADGRPAHVRRNASSAAAASTSAGSRSTVGQRSATASASGPSIAVAEST